MKKNIVLTLVLTACFAITAKAQSYEERAQAYIKTYCRMAVLEQQRSGIPAAITLAQGIHETSAGASELATEANNHFGIKCKKAWTGETFAHTDDAPDECFRKYKTAEESYKDHSDYLSTSPRYAELFKMSPTDYAAWAVGLRKCGYATNPKYATVLIKLIEDYHLQEFTYVALENPGSYSNDVAKVEKEIIPEKDAPETASANIPAAIPVGTTYGMPMPAVKASSKIVVDQDVTDAGPITYPPFGELVKVNGLKAVYAKKGDMPLEYALKYNIRYERLLEFNDINDRPLPDNMYLYLERKHARGMHNTHVVKEDDNMLKVAQYEGMQLKSIRMLNKLALGEEPVAGTVLQLQEDAQVKPEVVATTKVQPANIPVPEPYIVQKETPAIETQQEAKAEPIAAPPAGEEVVAKIPVDNTPETVVSYNDIAPAVKGPTPAVNIANEQPVEEVIAEEKVQQALPPQTLPAEPKKEEKPVDEFDALKAKFDRVVYAGRDAKAAETSVAEPAAATPKAEAPKQEPVAKPELKKEEVAKKQEQPKEELVTVKGKKYYTVKKGDTAFGIAKRNNLTMRELLNLNDLDFRELQVGQKLRVQ
jgi:LysM repeat protein